MNPEVQNALSRKVDDWKFNSLESEVRQLKSEQGIINNRIQIESSNNYRLKTAIETLVTVLIEQEVELDEATLNQLINIRSLL